MGTLELHGADGRSPSWYAVEGWMRLIARQWDGVVVVKVDVVPRKPDGGGLVWIVEFHTDSRLLPSTLKHRLWKRYPCTSHKTVPGLLYKLLFDLDVALSKAAEERGEQADLPF